ncbi:GNAT family N-acetyltransferase [Propioniciclava flava]
MDHGGRNAPDGWYLSGVVIAPDARRRGLGRRLTQERIDWALERGSAVYYVVAASNWASRALHGELGFEETHGRLPDAGRRLHPRRWLAVPSGRAP